MARESHQSVRPARQSAGVWGINFPAAPRMPATTIAYDPDRRVGADTAIPGRARAAHDQRHVHASRQAGLATGANGNVTRYAYDRVDRLSAVTHATGGAEVEGHPREPAREPPQFD